MAEFSLKQLEVFTEVAELGSFTRAAQELYLTQSTVSAHVAGLEQALGAQLFVRETRRQIRLTAEGRRLYPAAKRVLSDCRELRELVQDENAEPPLSLGASTVPAQYLLPDLLSEFLHRHAGSRYLLRRSDSAGIHELLRSGEIRIGFAGAVLEPEHLRYAPLAEDRLVLATENSPRYRELQSRGAWGRELLGEPTVAREEGSGTDRAVSAYMQSTGFPREQLHIVARVDSPESIKRMVERGAGVSVLSALAVRQEAAEGRLLTFEMDPEGLRRRIYMVWRPDVEYRRLERTFLEETRRWGREHLRTSAGAKKTEESDID